MLASFIPRVGKRPSHQDPLSPPDEPEEDAAAEPADDGAAAEPADDATAEPADDGDTAVQRTVEPSSRPAKGGGTGPQGRELEGREGMVRMGGKEGWADGGPLGG